jgi:hypothetical protein
MNIIEKILNRAEILFYGFFLLIFSALNLLILAGGIDLHVTLHGLSKHDIDTGNIIVLMWMVIAVLCLFITTGMLECYQNLKRILVPK